MKKIVLILLFSAVIFNGCFSTLKYGKDYMSPCGYYISHEGDNQPFTSVDPKYREEIAAGNIKTMNSYYILSLFPDSKARIEAARNDLGNVFVDNIALGVSYIVTLGYGLNAINLSFHLKPKSEQDTNTVFVTAGAAAVVILTGKVIFDVTSFVDNLNKSITEFNKACAGKPVEPEKPAK